MDTYFENILQRKSSNYSLNDAYNVKSFFEPAIREWSNGLLNEFFVAGSVAKGVSIKGKSDFDYFVSINCSCTDPLAFLYNSLCNALTDFGKKKGFTVRRQNVSLGIKGLVYYNNAIDIDIVPAKQQAINSDYHSLYKSKQNTWTQTNVKSHIDYIKNSHRQNFIKLIKIWRECHNLELPSMNLELAVLEALRGYFYDIPLERGFGLIMEYFRDSFVSSRLVDPCNANNVVSEDMTFQEKSLIKQKAQQAIQASNWSNVIW